jgi:hypothetical protein
VSRRVRTTVGREQQVRRRGFKSCDHDVEARSRSSGLVTLDVAQSYGFRLLRAASAKALLRHVQDLTPNDKSSIPRTKSSATGDQGILVGPLPYAGMSAE